MWASHWVTNNYNVPVKVKIAGDVTCTASGKPNIILTMPNKNVEYSHCGRSPENRYVLGFCEI